MPTTTLLPFVPSPVTQQVLAGDWRLAPDPENSGKAAGWPAVSPVDAVPAPVPGVITQAAPGCHGVAWYFHTFTPTRLPRRDERAVITFNAVDYLSEVWVNGSAVGGHEGGETPFTLDITRALQPGANLLAIRVINPTDTPIDGLLLAEIPHRNKVMDPSPGQFENYGGIMLPVTMSIVPEVRIIDLFARPHGVNGEVTVQVTLRNDDTSPAAVALTLESGPDRTGEIVTTLSPAPLTLTPGDTCVSYRLTIPAPHLWNIDDPFLYRLIARLTVQIEGDMPRGHVMQVRFGIRTFAVIDGFFHLNGKRLFLRSTHTGNHFPISGTAPTTPDFMRRDLLHAKASGFNMVRFISGMAWPEQLDYCDEIGLMIYEETLAGWVLADSPQMEARFTRSIAEMVRRDRNHPCITIWGLLNETENGPVFRTAVNTLPLVRTLDESRLVLLSSGRWDGQASIGSVSNPDSAVWEPAWGVEDPRAEDKDVILSWEPAGGYTENAGDIHIYPATPQDAASDRLIRQLGAGTKPVFLSEYGIGSLFNAIRELREFEQVGANPDLPDATLIRHMADGLEADWARWGFTGVYPFAEDMLHESQRKHARQRLLGFDLIRANPQICGYNLTGILDHALTGEGLWTFWRHWKPGIVDALCDGWAPLRWCLFVSPLHSYVNQPLLLEAVLANEDVLAPGAYPVRFRLVGPAGIAWERDTEVIIPTPPANGRGPLAVPVLREEITADMPGGEYVFAASLLRGGAPQGGRLTIHRTTPAWPPLTGTVHGWGLPETCGAWLSACGLTCRPYTGDRLEPGDVVLVGVPGDDPTVWATVTAGMARGATVLFLDPKAFTRGEDTMYWFPLPDKGSCTAFHDWLYHKECVAQPHPAFTDLPDRGIMDWDFYGPVIPHTFYTDVPTPDSVAAAAFAVGYCCAGGYTAGILLGDYQLGQGRFTINALNILPNLGTHPAADRLLINLLRNALDATA